MSELNEKLMRVSPFAAAAIAEFAAKGHARYTSATMRGMQEAERMLKREYRWRPFDPPRHA